MDNCKDNIEAISMLVDGELDEARAASLRAHIAQCDTCKKVYDAFSAVSDSIGGELVQPPEQLAKGVMFKIGLLSERRRKPRFAYGRFTAVAACLVLILFGANYFGLLGETALGPAAKQSAADASNEALEERAALDVAVPELTMFNSGGEAEDSQPAENGTGNTGDNAAPQLTGAEKNGNVTQFGFGSSLLDGTGSTQLPEEMSFQTFLDELIAYADKNSPDNADENYAFFRAGEEKTDPVTIRIYEGEYVRPTERVSASNLFNSSKNEDEQQPTAEFADLSNMRVLNSLLTNAEETDKTFDSAPSYTIAVFNSDGALMDDEILPLRLWIHGGHIYFEADAKGTLLCASVKPDELLKLIETFESKEK